MRRRSEIRVRAIALAYALFGGLWILLSDKALELMFQDSDALVRASIAKGWFFVAVTTVALYLMMRQLARALIASHQRELALERERHLPPPMLVAIADASPDAIFAKDEEGRYLLFNNAACRIVGKPMDEVLGRDDRSLFPIGQARELIECDRVIRRDGATQSGEETLQTAVGERAYHTIRGPLRAPDGAIFGTYGISRDITERKRSEILLRESQARLRLLIDHAPAALAMFDRQMCYLEASRRWREDYRLGDRQIIGVSHYEVFPEVSEDWKALHRRALAGETLSSSEDRFERLDGSVQWLRWEVRPWRTDDGSVGGIVIFAEDITPGKAAELELRSRNQELERFNHAAIERELRMIALKSEVNELAQAAGRAAPYNLAFAEDYGTRSTQ